MSDPSNPNRYSRYVFGTDGRWYGYLFTDKGIEYGDLLPVSGNRVPSHS